MPQTLLGLFALVLASLLTFNQQRLQQRAYRSMLADEISISASGTAMNVLELIAARSFDEQTTPWRVHQRGEIPRGAELFSGADAFEGDRGDDGCDYLDPALTPGCDDVDDVNGLGWQPLSVTLANGRSLPFEVNARVFYVESVGDTTPADGPTLNKRVELAIRSPLLPEFPTGFITLDRVVSYDPLKAEFDAEQACGPMGTAPTCTYDEGEVTIPMPG